MSNKGLFGPQCAISRMSYDSKAWITTGAAHHPPITSGTAAFLWRTRCLLCDGLHWLHGPMDHGSKNYDQGFSHLPSIFRTRPRSGEGVVQRNRSLKLVFLESPFFLCPRKFALKRTELLRIKWEQVAVHVRVLDDRFSARRLLRCFGAPPKIHKAWPENRQTHHPNPRRVVDAELRTVWMPQLTLRSQHHDWDRCPMAICDLRFWSWNTIRLLGLHTAALFWAAWFL